MRGADGAVRSGQPTLMNIIGCLDRPTSGDYLFCGREVGRLDDDELSRIRKSRIGFVFQNFNLLPRLTAAGNVELPLVYAGVSGRGVMTEPCRLLRPASGSWIARDISLRRAVWARSGALPSPGTDRPVPDSGGRADQHLDSRSGAQILDLLLTLHRGGRTILIVTHDETVATRAGRVIHLRDGRI